jgi:spore coat protein A
VTQTGTTRNLVLFEGLDQYGRLQPLLGTLNQGSLAWFDPITENPMVNDVEVWEVYNATEDAHPIHLHLVSFQILNRECFDGEVEEKAQPQHDGSEGVGGILTVNSLGGDARDPEPNEMGWKDTAVMLPGEVTRVIARFDREGRYVWHCHILSHEDHEMMRPFYVGPMGVAMNNSNTVLDQDLKDGNMLPNSFMLLQNYPNPFNPATEIGFHLPDAGYAEVKVFNVLGQEIRTLASKNFSGGVHNVNWDGKDASGNDVSSGMYFYQLRAGDFVQLKKMVLLR